VQVVSDGEDDSDKCAGKMSVTQAIALSDGVSTATPQTTVDDDRQCRFFSGSGPSATVKFSLGAADEDEGRSCGPAVAWPPPDTEFSPHADPVAAVERPSTSKCSELVERPPPRSPRQMMARRSKRATDVDAAISRVSRQLQHNRRAVGTGPADPAPAGPII